MVFGWLWVVGRTGILQKNTWRYNYTHIHTHCCHRNYLHYEPNAGEASACLPWRVGPEKQKRPCWRRLIEKPFSRNALSALALHINKPPSLLSFSPSLFFLHPSLPPSLPPVLPFPHTFNLSKQRSQKNRNQIACKIRVLCLCSVYSNTPSGCTPVTCLFGIFHSVGLS